MTTWQRAGRLPLGAEVALACLTAVVSFTVGAFVASAAEAVAVVVLLGVAFVAAVTAIARFWGVAFAVPAAMAGLLAYDWFYLPPTHPLEFPDSANLVDLLVFLAVAVLIGQVTAYAGRRADLFEAARSVLAEEQAALRRVATLVARELPPDEVLSAVAQEVARLLDAEATKIYRYEEDGTVTVVAAWGVCNPTMPVGSQVLRTGRPARIDDYTVASPILVEGRVWGTMVAASRADAPLPAGTELRIGDFTELVALAVSNIQARSDLAASRARILAATDEERRRVVRDLHDGAQQRLVHTVITLKLARRTLEAEDGDGAALVTEALEQAERATAELRELAHGILPSVLTHGGLHGAVDALASRTPVPVENNVSVRRLPPAVEATAYFVVAEALTNVAKHAKARRATVTAHVEHGTLEVYVRDDGVGGAQAEGFGLLGLRDRLAALDGRLRVESAVNDGTLVAAAIPIPG